MCLERKIVAIVELDRVALKGYLTGEISSCPQIDVAAQGTTPKVSTSGEITAPTKYNIASKSSGSITPSEPLIPEADLLQFRLSRRSSKRKLIDTEGEAVDPTFLAADKRDLQMRRAGEIPAQTRATVLSKPGAVCLLP